MKNMRRVITVGTTFFVAAAVGHVMQSGETISARLRDASIPAAVLVSEAENTALRDAVLVSASFGGPTNLPDFPDVEPFALKSSQLLAGRLDGHSTISQLPKTDPVGQHAGFETTCSIGNMTLAPVGWAMLTVTLQAQCNPNEKVVISHSGLKFAIATDDNGRVEFQLPALTNDGLVTAQMASGDSFTARHNVTDLRDLNRLALQWQGNQDLQLIATQHDATHAAENLGFLTVLGDPSLDHPLLVEVYTAPAGTKLADLRIEVGISDANCARPLRGETLRMVPNAKPDIAALSFSMPECDAVGDYLMMDVADLMDPTVTLAAN
ncbi:MAG: hypothetical protein WBH14_01780 [Albidovulum sp.]